MSYQREYPEDFVDNFVSPPELLFRKAAKDPYRKAIKVNQTMLDFQPLARFCKGTREKGWLKECLCCSEENPYGNLVFGTERCPSCGKLSDYVDCLIDKPKCNGLDVSCKKTEFAGKICNGDFGVYLTRYSNTLKVGKALLCNLIPRLLDQGANSAVLLYPISNIHTTYQLEHKLRDYLQKNIQAIGQPITEATLSSPKTIPKIKEFLSNWTATIPTF